MEFALFCKSFRRDLERFARLFASFDKYAEAGMRLVLSVPDADRSLFAQRFGTSRLEITTDERILGRQLEQTWRTQQVVKLRAFRLGFADAWVVIDSDCYFIRPFGKSDFVRGDDKVALVASLSSHVFDHHEHLLLGYLRGEHELPALSSEAAHGLTDRSKPLGSIPWAHRLIDAVRKGSLESRIGRISRLFRRQGPNLNYLPCAIWTQQSLASLEQEFLEPRQLGFEDLIAYSPWEADWVGEWEIYRGVPQRFLTESFFLHFASDAAIERGRSAGISTADVARRYVGMQLAAGHQLIEQY